MFSRQSSPESQVTDATGAPEQGERDDTRWGLFLVDNSEFESKEVGLQYCRSKDRADIVQGKIAMWGERVEGILEDCHAWIKVRGYYLPRHFVIGTQKEVTVLIEEPKSGKMELMLDNSELKLDAPGLHFHKKKDPKTITDKTVKWGEMVRGFLDIADDGTRWLKVGKLFLPTTVGRAQVFKRQKDVFQVNNYRLNTFDPSGLEYRRSKRWNDIKRHHHNGTPMYEAWGSFVVGTLDELDGDPWIHIDEHRWLPVYVDNQQVMISLGEHKEWWSEVGRMIRDRNSDAHWKGIKEFKKMFPLFGHIEKPETMQMVMQMLLGYLLNGGNWVRLSCMEAMLVLTDLSRQKYGSCAAQGLDLAPWFESHLTDSFQPVRLKAIEGLSKMPNAGTDTADTLGVLAVTDKSELLRQEATRVLGRFGAEASVELVHLLANCDTWAVRREAALALGGMECWKEPDVDQKYLNRALKALTTYLAPIHPAVDVNEQKERQAQVREACAEGLGMLGWNAFSKISKLIVALKDRSLRVRISAGAAISKILSEAKKNHEVDLHDLLHLLDGERPQGPVASTKSDKEKAKGKHAGSSDEHVCLSQMLHLAARSLIALMRETMACLVLHRMQGTPPSSGESPKHVLSSTSLGSMAQTDMDPEYVLGLFETVNQAIGRIGILLVPALTRTLALSEGKWRRVFNRYCSMRALSATGDLQDDVLCAMLSEWTGSASMGKVSQECGDDVALLDLTSPLLAGRLVACSFRTYDDDLNPGSPEIMTTEPSNANIMPHPLDPTTKRARPLPRWALLFGFDGNPYLAFAVADDHDALLKEELQCETIVVETITGSEPVQVHKRVMELARKIFPDIKQELIPIVDRMLENGVNVERLCFCGFGVGGSLAKAVLLLFLTDSQVFGHYHLSKILTPKHGNGGIALMSYGTMGITRVQLTSSILKCFSKDSAAFCFEDDTLPYVSGNNAELAAAHLIHQDSFSQRVTKSVCCRRHHPMQTHREVQERRLKVKAILKRKENDEEANGFSKLVPKVIVKFAPVDSPDEQIWMSTSSSRIIKGRTYTNAMVWRHMQAKIAAQKQQRKEKEGISNISKMLKQGTMSIGQDGNLTSKAEDAFDPSSAYSHDDMKYSQLVPPRDGKKDEAPHAGPLDLMQGQAEPMSSQSTLKSTREMTGPRKSQRRIVKDVLRRSVTTDGQKMLEGASSEFHHRRIGRLLDTSVDEVGTTSV